MDYNQQTVAALVTNSNSHEREIQALHRYYSSLLQRMGRLEERVYQLENAKVQPDAQALQAMAEQAQTISKLLEKIDALEKENLSLSRG